MVELDLELHVEHAVDHLKHLEGFPFVQTGLAFELLAGPLRCFRTDVLEDLGWVSPATTRWWTLR